MGHIHSPNRIPEQVEFSLDLNKTLDSLEDTLLRIKSDQAVLDFLGSSTGKDLLTGGSYTIEKLVTTPMNTELRTKITKLLCNCPDEVVTFSGVFHQGTIFHSCDHGHRDSKRDSTICMYLSADAIEKVGKIKKFFIVNSQPVPLVEPFVQSGSLLEQVGVSGRDILAKMDLLSSFVIQVDNNQSSTVIAVTLSSIIGKCINVCSQGSSISYIIKLPNHYECH